MPRLNVPQYNDPVEELLRGSRKDYETTPLGYSVPTEPSSLESVYAAIKAMVTDPSNVGMPGAGISYRGARQAVDKMLQRASQSGYKHLEQALLESNPADVIHPDALQYMNNIRISDVIDSPGMIRYTPPSGNTPIIPLTGDFTQPLVERGGRAKSGSTYTVLYNPHLAEKVGTERINPAYTKGVVDHEIAHANHLFGGEVEMPAYDAVLQGGRLPKDIVNNYNFEIMMGLDQFPGTANFERYLNYFTKNPDELVAQLTAVRNTSPETAKRFLPPAKQNLSEHLIQAPSRSDAKLLDPVYHQSLLDFMKR